MAGSKRFHGFEGRSGEDFYLWAARAEAALDGKEVLNVFVADVIGDGTGDISLVIKLSVAKVHAFIVQGLVYMPLRLCCSETDNPFKI